MNEELPEITFEEMREKMLEYFNQGDFKRGVGIWLYYKLGQEDFQDKTTQALMDAIKEYKDSWSQSSEQKVSE